MNAEAQSVTRAYATFGAVYDLIFGHTLAQGRRAGVECMNLQPGNRVLEVGVGTGLSLPDYPPGVKITGVDISPQMLEKARKRVDDRRLSQVEELSCMDAQSMHFEDHTFDGVIAMYIMAVVPDPYQVLREIQRVCRPGGHLVIVNYFREGNKKFRLNEWIVKPLGKMFHFSFGLDVDDFAERGRLHVLESFRANIFNHTTVLHCANNGVDKKQTQ
ncbi:MAG: methyltransferase domain-containing protein [Kiritimatiellia bacterium]